MKILRFFNYMCIFALGYAVLCTIDGLWLPVFALLVVIYGLSVHALIEAIDDEDNVMVGALMVCLPFTLYVADLQLLNAQTNFFMLVGTVVLCMLIYTAMTFLLYQLFLPLED